MVYVNYNVLRIIQAQRYLSLCNLEVLLIDQDSSSAGRGDGGAMSVSNSPASQLLSDQRVQRKKKR